MAYAGQQFQYEAMLMEERLDTPLICGCCFSDGIYCDFHGSIYPDLPSQPSTTQLESSFDDDEAWTTNDSGSFLDSYQSSSSSSVHGFGQASTDASSASEESSSSSSEDEKFLTRSKPCCQNSVHEQKYPSSLRSRGQVLQNCNESLTVESLPINAAHNQFISPAMLISANNTITHYEAKPKKRQRTQEEPEMVQPHRNTDADIQSTAPTRKNLLDPQILLQTQSSEKQALLHQLLGIYAEFTSPLDPQNLQTFEGLAALINRLVKDWMNKPSHLKCLKDRDGVPIPPADRDPEKPFACVCGCGYTSSTLGSLERHLSQNWLASYWQCPLCDERFDRRDTLSAHLRSKQHLESSEKVNEERDFHRNGCDDDFTKQCGFCGEICKGFKVFTRHLGKHFRGASSKPPKSMHDWRDTWDDDDDDSNSDDGKGAGRTGKPNNNGGRHDRGGGSNGGGSNGGTSGSSKGGEHGSSKGSGQSRDRGTKQGNARSGHSSTYGSGGSGFRASDSSSTDGSISLPDSALSSNVRHIRERRKAWGFPLRSKKTEKQPLRPPVVENKIDTIEAPTQNALPQVSGPPRRGPQSSEVIFDAAERWKAFRLKYDSSSLRTQDAKTREHSQLRPSLEAPLQPRPRKDNSASAGTNVKGSDQINKTTDGLATSRASSEEASHNSSILDAKRIIKQRKKSKRRLRDEATVRLRASTSPLADIDPDPFGVSRIFEGSGKPFRRDDFDLNWSEDMSFPSVEQKKNASRPPFQYEDTAFKMADNLNFKWKASSYRKQESQVQEQVPRHREVFVQRHRESSRRDWFSVPPLHQFLQSAAPVLSPDPHIIRKRGSTARAQPDQLQPVPLPRSEDHGKHHGGDLKCPPRSSSLDRGEQKAQGHGNEDQTRRSVLDFVPYSDVPELPMFSCSGFHSWTPLFAPINNYGGNEIGEPGINPSDVQSAVGTYSAAPLTSPKHIRIPTITAYTQPGAMPMSCTAFADSGADQNIISEDISERLGLEMDHPNCGAPSLLKMPQWQNKEEHPSDMTATHMLNMYGALHSTPPDDGLSASFTCSFSIFAYKDYRSSSSQEVTSVSNLKRHLSRAHTRPDWTCHCCFKMFRTRSKWLGHAERRLCSVDHLRSQALIAKDWKIRMSGSLLRARGVGQMLPICRNSSSDAGMPLLHPHILSHEDTSILSAAFSRHDHHGFGVSEGCRISDRVLWAYQSTLLARSHRIPINSRNSIIVLRGLEQSLGLVRIRAYDKNLRDHNFEDVLKGYLEMFFLSNKGILILRIHFGPSGICPSDCSNFREKIWNFNNPLLLANMVWQRSES